MVALAVLPDGWGGNGRVSCAAAGMAKRIKTAMQAAKCKPRCLIVSLQSSRVRQLSCCARCAYRQNPPVTFAARMNEIPILVGNVVTAVCFVYCPFGKVAIVQR